MPVNHCLHILTRVTGIDNLLRALASRLIPSDREALLACLPWTPKYTSKASSAPIVYRSGILGLYEHELRLLVPVESNLLDHIDVWRGIERAGPDTMSVRLEFDIEAGDRFANLTVLAPFSMTSSYIAKSQYVRKAFTQISRESNSLAAFWASEFQYPDWELVYPAMRKVPSPKGEYWLESIKPEATPKIEGGLNRMLDDDDEIFRVDDFIESALESAGLPST